MKTNDTRTERKEPRKRMLRFTCPECGHDELAECHGGHASRTFIEAVVSQTTNSKEVNEINGKSERFEIRYAARADGSPDRDFVEDNYGVSSLQWFACGDCDFVLGSEDGHPLEDEESLAEWLAENCSQEETPPAAGKNHPKA